MAELFDKNAFKNWLATAFSHDYAEKLHIGRGAMAAGYGLPVQPEAGFVRPFPGTSTNVTVQQQTEPTKTSGANGGTAGAIGKLLLAVVLGVALAAPMGLLGGALAVWLMQKPTAARPADGEVEVHVIWDGEEIHPGKPVEAVVIPK